LVTNSTGAQADQSDPECQKRCQNSSTFRLDSPRRLPKPIDGSQCYAPWLRALPDRAREQES